MTKTITAAEAIERITFNLNHESEYAQTTIKKFADRMATDPIGAFEWGEDAAFAAGVVFQNQRALATLAEEGEPAENLKRLHTALAYEVRREARSRACSTSGMANIAATAKRVAMADLFEMVDRNFLMIGAAE